MTALFRQFIYKKFGILPFETNVAGQVNHAEYHPYIKILFLKKDGHITIDFNKYTLQQDALFFINVNQWYELSTPNNACNGALLYYNRDFYCVEIHDKEVACDGILYNNVYEIPVVYLSKEESGLVEGILNEIVQEVKNDEPAMEEMLRILLKKLIIKATRIWKTEHDIASTETRQDIEFLRKFSQLVELHFKTQHTVADYAKMLSVSPKLLNKRITQYGNTAPNDLIKERIILEAKRLLAHTQLSVKEIGYSLGYDDPAYFVRLFTKQAGLSPVEFRKQYKPA
ncbi:helix-turn-helix domain-containing protein [Niastella caeni]|uniref:Helix-turn-helix domain-containing protein n=1 Tax=Niastella caeni TaxID=2569763 RepID=A0A4S8HXU7_9BACT|nr:AraC family transcriptional regulator [Niastella caeni]THU40563.1 helix-turn-helix domain-containing protein [Niastella caeni]